MTHLHALRPEASADFLCLIDVLVILIDCLLVLIDFLMLSFDICLMLKVFWRIEFVLATVDCG